MLRFYLRACLLHEAGRHLLRFNDLLLECGFLVPDAHRASLMMSYLGFVQLYDRAGGKFRPKWHLICHAIDESQRMGNPRYLMVYKDETMNGALARIARSAHRRSWQMVMFRKFNLMKALAMPAAMR